MTLGTAHGCCRCLLLVPPHHSPLLLLPSPPQVGLLADVLRELSPLLHYTAAAPAGEGGSSGPTLLLDLLARGLLAPPPGAGTGGRAALASLAAALSQQQGQRSPGPTAAADAASVAPAVLQPAAMLRHVVLPCLRSMRCGDLLAPLQLAWALLSAGDGCGPSGAGGNSSSAGAGAGRTAAVRAAPAAAPGAELAGGELAAELAAQLAALLDFGQRRVDGSSCVLHTPPEVFQMAGQALALLQGQGQGQQPPATPRPAPAAAAAANAAAARIAVGAAAAPPSAGAYLWSRLLPVLRHQGPGRLPALRAALVAECGAILPACTQPEAQQLLSTTLPELIASALGAGARGEAAAEAAAEAASEAALQAAAFEAAVRATHALALLPEVVPLAGEGEEDQEAGGAGAGRGAEARPCTQAAAAAAAAALEGWEGPSPLRRVAVERTIQHLCWLASCLAAPASQQQQQQQQPEEGDQPYHQPQAQQQQQPQQPQPQPQPRWPRVQQAALTARCFRELCRLGVALQPHYDCTTLQVCLVQLVQQQLVQQQLLLGGEGRSPGAGRTGTATAGSPAAGTAAPSKARGGLPGPPSPAGWLGAADAEQAEHSRQEAEAEWGRQRSELLAELRQAAGQLGGSMHAMVALAIQVAAAGVPEDVPD